MRSAILLSLLFLAGCTSPGRLLPPGCSASASCAVEAVSGGFEARVHIFRRYVPDPGQALGEECRALATQVAETEAARRGFAKRRVASEDVVVSSRRVPGGYASCTALAWMPQA